MAPTRLTVSLSAGHPEARGATAARLRTAGALCDGTQYSAHNRRRHRLCVAGGHGARVCVYRPEERCRDAHSAGVCRHPGAATRCAVFRDWKKRNDLCASGLLSPLEVHACGSTHDPAGQWILI